MTKIMTTYERVFAALFTLTIGTFGGCMAGLVGGELVAGALGKPPSYDWVFGAMILCGVIGLGLGIWNVVSEQRSEDQ